MIWFCFGKENNSSRRVILKIELELNNPNSILSRSAVTPVFPVCCSALQSVAACCNVCRWRTVHFVDGNCVHLCEN